MGSSNDREASAKRQGALDEEAREVGVQAASKRTAEFLKAADAMRARLAGRQHTETLELLREDRDR